MEIACSRVDTAAYMYKTPNEDYMRAELLRCQTNADVVIAESIVNISGLGAPERLCAVASHAAWKAFDW